MNVFVIVLFPLSDRTTIVPWLELLVCCLNYYTLKILYTVSFLQTNLCSERDRSEENWLEINALFVELDTEMQKRAD